MTKNLHLEHPEDQALSGDISIFDWFTTSGNLSVKLDGSPALVFGTNPANEKFFVGTKSVFNKVKIKIAHSHEEIDAFYGGQVADILHSCFDCLPHTNYIIQGDFIGFGGFEEYCPNTITYKFPEIVTEKIIIAPHTIYTAKNDLREAIAHPLEFNFEETTFPNLYVKWVQPKAYIVHSQDAFYDVENICNFARQMSTTCNFVQGKQLIELKKQLNACIREEREIKPEQFNCDPNLIRFWKLVKSIKEDCLFLCRNNGPEAYLGYDRIDSEGYVMSNKYGMYKLVNREVFSHANFNIQKNWCK
jgi:hypothetical protein